MKKNSDAEELLAFHVRAAKLQSPEREFRFDATRQWRFDFAWPAKMIAVEVEGGIWNKGRHTRGLGFLHDCEKYNCAELLGWMVLRFPVQLIKSGEAIRMIEKAMKIKDGYGT